MKLSSSYAYNFWSIVFINIVFFLGFVLLFAFPRKKMEWRSMGTLAAFIVALFSEMYGFPLTIYVLTSLLGRNYPTSNPFGHQQGHLWAALIGWKYVTLICSFGSLVLLGGMVLVWLGWKKIHREQGKLVKDGIYAFLRHPQYLGLILITAGLLIQWPTFITLLMWPILVVAYIQLARAEEREMREKFGNDYLDYCQKIPGFIPSFFIRRKAPL